MDCGALALGVSQEKCDAVSNNQVNSAIDTAFLVAQKGVDSEEDQNQLNEIRSETKMVQTFLKTCKDTKNLPITQKGLKIYEAFNAETASPEKITQVNE